MYILMFITSSAVSCLCSIDIDESLSSENLISLKKDVAQLKNCSV